MIRIRMGMLTITSRSGAEGAKVGGGLEDELEAGVRPRIPPTFSNMMVTMSWSMMIDDDDGDHEDHNDKHQDGG